MPARDVNPLGQLANNRFAAPTLRSEARLLYFDFNVTEASPTEPLQSLCLILYRMGRGRDVRRSCRKWARTQGIRVVPAHIYRTVCAGVEFRRDRLARGEGELGEESMRGDWD